MSIEVRELRGGYRADVPILNGISLRAPDERIVTVVGPNGSGKSTLLKVIMGYLNPSGGEVIVDGARLGRTSVHRRVLDHGLGYVPQRANVFTSLSVRENLELGGASLRRRARRKRAGELLELYPELGRSPARRADTLSGGERQMLAIARALMTRPRYLLLDEPSAGLSPLAARHLFTTLAELRDQQGVTILLVEQNARQSLAISDEGVVLVLGKVELVAEPSALLNDPRVVALYLGAAAEQQSRRNQHAASSRTRSTGARR